MDFDVDARYSVYTYDIEEGKFTPQEGLEEPSQCVDIFQVKRVLRELQAWGYECWRRGNLDDGHDGDPSVLVINVDELDDIPLVPPELAHAQHVLHSVHEPALSPDI